MQKSHIIIIIIAVSAVALLFTLPKVIVKTDKQLQSSSTVTEKEESTHSVKDIHKVDVSENDRKNINNLRNAFYSVSNKEKKLTFADSLAKYYKKLHLYDSSAMFTEEAATLNPGPEKWLAAGDSYFEAFSFSEGPNKLGYNEKAKKYYEKILNSDPKNLEVKSKLAMTFVGGEETMEGVKLLREVLDVDPNNESAIYNLGILSIQSSQYDKAISRFKDLIKINPSNSGAHFYLGLSYMNKGNKDKAAESFKKAKSLDQDPGFQATVDSYLKDLK